MNEYYAVINCYDDKGVRHGGGSVLYASSVPLNYNGITTIAERFREKNKVRPELYVEVSFIQKLPI
jgi:hypothetical protein